MIKIKKNDSLLEAIKKVQTHKDTEVFLHFPIWHGILHDYSSLKILKKSCKSKKIIIVTKDVSAKSYIKKVGLQSSFIKDEWYLKQHVENKQHLLKTNTSFWEYLQYELKKKWNQIQKKLKKKVPKKYKHSFPFIFVLSIFLISLILLLFIFYLAVHKTYIYVTPEVEIMKVQRNFVFHNSEELSLDENMIKMSTVDIEVSLQDTFSSTNIDYETTTQASWEVEILNELTKSITVVQGTRLVSEEGIIYKIQKKTTIQGKLSESEEAASTIVYVVAEPFDQEWNFVGTRANTQNIVLNIPGLQWEFKNRIYWKAKELSGWSDSYEVVVWEDDIENWAKLLRLKLENEARKKLQEKIQAINTENNENYALLLSDSSLQYSDFIYNNTANTVPWEKKRKFELDGSIKLKAFLYNKNFVFSQLKSIAQDKIIDENQELIIIDKESLILLYNIYDRINDDWIVRIKATMEIEALVRNTFDQKWYYSELLKNKIRGLEKQEAYDILLNGNDINKVTIRNSPFFIQKISTKPENIFFKIND